MNRRRVDVAIIGDGPSGSALAQACRRRGADAVLIGPDDPWSATYATWVDDVPAEMLVEHADLFASTSGEVRVHALREHVLDRPYAVFDNHGLRRVARAGVEHLVARVETVAVADGRPLVRTTGGDELAARFVVDATGRPAAFAAASPDAAPAWQTAFGVVLPEPPTGSLGAATLMDFREVPFGPSGDCATFCYSIPVHDGWLVEETVLASTQPVDPDHLVPRLAARLGRTVDELFRTATRTERVCIPMGGTPRLADGFVAFGAAAGLIHPATGFSVAASLRAAPRVAGALVADEATTASVREAVWPRRQRRARILHDYGLDVLLRLDPSEVAAFFDAFFDLPRARWAAYLRVDAGPTEVAAAMTEVFRSTTWPMRRRLMRGNPLALARLLRP